MTVSSMQQMGEALIASRIRHPAGFADRGCADCVPDGAGRVALCETHIVVPLSRHYHGEATFGPAPVTVYLADLRNGELVATWPLRDVRPGEAGGYAWGYGGSGVHKLARALLADATGVVRPAEWEVTDFALAVLADLDGGAALALTQCDVLTWLYDYRGHKGSKAVSR